MPLQFSIIKQYTESYKSYKWFIWALEKYNNNNFWVMKKNNNNNKNKLITYWFPDKQLLSCSYISNHMLKIIHTDANHTDGCPI